MDHTLYENTALQEKADGGVPVSIEVFRTMRSETQHEFEA
jgi:hypothetical protein